MLPVWLVHRWRSTSYIISNLPFCVSACIYPVGSLKRSQLTLRLPSSLVDLCSSDGLLDWIAPSSCLLHLHKGGHGFLFSSDTIPFFWLPSPLLSFYKKLLVSLFYLLRLFKGRVTLRALMDRYLMDECDFNNFLLICWVFFKTLHLLKFI